MGGEEGVAGIQNTPMVLYVVVDTQHFRNPLSTATWFDEGSNRALAQTCSAAHVSA